MNGLQDQECRLEGQHAVITGGGRGIGAAIARQLAAAGVRLTLIGRTKDQLERTASVLNAAVSVLDVTDEAAVTRAFETFGEIDILVNCAGTARSAPFQDTDRALWDGMMSVNLTATYLCCRATIGRMLERNYGRIVNVASMAGLEPYRYVAAYVAAKHGVVGLTRALAMEMAETGITVNAVCPGYTDTALFRDAANSMAQRSGRTQEEAARALLRSIRQARLIDPEEVARLVRWLCRREASAVTGESFVLSGGRIA